MRLEKVEQHFVHLSFSRQDCALIAHMLNTAAMHEGTGRGHEYLVGSWLDATLTMFLCAALAADAGGIILDSIPHVTDTCRKNFDPAAIRDLAQALIDGEAPVD